MLQFEENFCKVLLTITFCIQECKKCGFEIRNIFDMLIYTLCMFIYLYMFICIVYICLFVFYLYYLFVLYIYIYIYLFVLYR